MNGGVRGLNCEHCLVARAYKQNRNSGLLLSTYRRIHAAEGRNSHVQHPASSFRLSQLSSFSKNSQNSKNSKKIA